jgi:hypothetical protein
LYAARNAKAAMAKQAKNEWSLDHGIRIMWNYGKKTKILSQTKTKIYLQQTVSKTNNNK